MTCVSIATTKESLTIGADSTASSDDLYVRAVTRKFVCLPKYVLGFSGSWGTARPIFDFFINKVPNENIYVALNDYLDQYETDADDFTLLVATFGVIYEVSPDKSAIQILPDSSGVSYYATGTGAAYALGAINALLSTGKNDTEELVRLSLEAAESHSLSVRPPFNVKTLTDKG